MRGSVELLVTWFLVSVAGGTEHVYRPSRRVCAVGAARGPVLESFVQRVYQPFLTTCDGHRACSTYRTIYRTAYRHSPGPALTRPRYACCPGWKRTGGLPGACGTAICQPPCGNGGSCVWPGRCRCPAGWRGDTCHTDVDECNTGEASCPQHCVNTAGSYWCQCWEGHSLSEDGTLCLPKEDSSQVAPNPTTGMDSPVREEVHRLRSRVDVLEQVPARRSCEGHLGTHTGLSGHLHPSQLDSRHLLVSLLCQVAGTWTWGRVLLCECQGRYDGCLPVGRVRACLHFFHNKIRT
uniref:epidermal growth factor-like protein 7 isoform X1 n=1 Tax=Jaculus jaculus TaxID=51337 RepID=UPI001E1B5933|nr:epidermal growth factor-like protein 7 isoform X1 [Jaculus jaculus]XP_044997552.1 epidermal growth factor-like protein 7 isoform X1 [Jaculus jaculus]